MKRIFYVPAVLLAVLAVLSTTVLAQNSLRLNSLRVQIWPEFDRPETLIIYQGELASTVQLPAVVALTLPGHIEEMNAVAVVDESGRLVNVPAETISLTQIGDVTLLTFQADSPRFQVEYYDPAVLSRQDSQRTLTFDLTVPYPAETMTVELQEPFQAEEFSLTPAETDFFVGQDGLTYHIIEVSAAEAGQTVAVQATYHRQIDTLSAEARLAPAGDELDIPTEPVVTSDGFSLFDGSIAGYVLIVAGVMLLVGTGVYWWWSSRRAAEEPVRRRPASGKPRRKSASKRQAASAPAPKKQPAGAPAAYCHQCGAALRPGANFCHQCGAERRK